MAKVPKKYFKDGKEHTGVTHKTPDGSLHSGSRHIKISRPVVSLKDLSERATKKARPS
tara:strand:- start:485 stop:658 length:174 start_codon:yes stop_codon:yes gene_type:complete